MINQNTRFLIVGLGLIGGSYAMGLKKQGYHVDAIEINQLSIDYAIENNIIDYGSTFDIDLIKNADIIISGLYPNTMIEWITTYQQYFKPQVLISDVSGVKSNIVDQVQSILRKDVSFIASHPMAGKEVSGVKYADNNIFEQANFIITPTDLNNQVEIDTMIHFAKILNFQNISVLSCKEHDKMIAFVSQLTHAIAVSLMNASDNPDLVKYTGDSFRDLTRIANINENLWSELFFLNKDYLLAEIDNFMDSLTILRQTLVDNDKDKLKDLFVTSTIRRQRFNKK